MYPKISVIVPIYNIKDYVERCVDSIVNQSYRNLEIILVNDGSNDGSEEKILKYHKDLRVRIINKTNEGLSNARNDGIAMSTGEYVLFVDGDDFLEQECIEKLVYLIDYKTDIIMFPYSKEYGNRSEKCYLFKDKEIYFEEEEVKKYIYARLIGPEISIIPISPVTMDRLNTAWGKLYKKKLIEDICFSDTKEIGPEDCWYNIQVFSKAKLVKYTTSTFYRYEKGNSTSLLHVYNSDLLEKRWRFYEKVISFMNSNMDYKVNLSNRIICEEFGLLLNIYRSELARDQKQNEVKRLLNDSRYREYYSNAQIAHYSFPWRHFYWLCKYKKVVGLNAFFALLKFREK